MAPSWRGPGWSKGPWFKQFAAVAIEPRGAGSLNRRKNWLNSSSSGGVSTGPDAPMEVFYDDDVIMQLPGSPWRTRTSGTSATRRRAAHRNPRLRPGGAHTGARERGPGGSDLDASATGAAGRGPSQGGDTSAARWPPDSRGLHTASAGTRDGPAASGRTADRARRTGE